MGLSVDAVSNVDQLYEKVRTPEFDVIILDLMIDGEGGVSIIRKLREINHDIPVIAIADCDLELMEQALAAGCSKYLAKPVSRRQLYDAIFELLQLSIFEKKLKEMGTVDSPLKDDVVLEECPPQELSDIVKETLAPGEILKLLPELFQELPKTFDSISAAQSNEIMDVFDRLYALCENEDRRIEIKELQSFFESKQGTADQCKDIQLRLEEICRNIHECCQKKS